MLRAAAQGAEVVRSQDRFGLQCETDEELGLWGSGHEVHVGIRIKGANVWTPV